MAVTTDKTNQFQATKRMSAAQILRAEKVEATRILLAAGYSTRAVAQVMRINAETVNRWKKELANEKEPPPALPGLRLATDRLSCAIPMAVERVIQLIQSKRENIALDAAKTLLISNHVLKDRKTLEIEEHFDEPTANIVKRAEQLIAQREDVSHE